MPRRHFQADLQKAADGVSIAGISNVRAGGDDGEFTFMCIADGEQLEVSALIPELSDYPTSHTCMVFGTDNASASVAAALSDIADAASGKTVPQILELVSTRLESTDRDGDQQMLDSQQFEDFDDDEEEEDDDEYFPGDEDLMPKPRFTNGGTAFLGCGHTEATSAFRQRIRSDLLIAKSEGFKVGHLGSLMDGLGCYVSLSIRISKLGISEEAMQAWQVEPSEYFVAVFYYPSGYKNMDDLRSYDAQQARRNFGIRVGVCTTYKPTMQEAISAFTVLSRDEEKQREESQQGDSQNVSSTLPKGFRNSFISRPLNELLEQRFHMLLKYRYGGMLWQGSESFYNDQILNASRSDHDASHDKYYENERVSDAWPKIVTYDHIIDSVGQEHSLPLVGMQFVLRHFVRCTEFCLICFSRMPDDLQAIKPYVCDKPLCLYQYMSLGFGPSIEHEILSQPKVVDLLVSFCYASACANRLRDFPTGLSLAVPPPVSNERDYFTVQTQTYTSAANPPQPVLPQAKMPPPAALSMRYKASALEMLFDDARQACPVSNGHWIVIWTDDNPSKALHCRVVDASLYPAVKVSSPVIPVVGEISNDPYHMSRQDPSQQTQQKISAPQPGSDQEFRSASFYVYNQNFDDLDDHEKPQAIATLLDLVPPVQEMRKYLLRKSQSPLSAWVDRLSPAVLGILRWVIASNRACILQVDGEDNDSNARSPEERLYGMAGWSQFRFAMGAPDKERRFIQAVKDTTDRLGLKYPTLFAWHGSPIHNWHTIIREGLHFKETAHGRAFGHGVYHAPDVNTSLGYSQYGCGASWTVSELKVQQSLALNEIVNAPKEFVSQTPHLVVAQLDWIQTRYLFVKSRTDNTAATEPGTKPLLCVEQDPSRTPRGVTGDLIIPLHAIAASRRPKAKATGNHKRQKASGKSQYDPIKIDDDDDGSSVATLDEDRIIFECDDEHKSAPELDSLPTPNSIMGDKGKSKMASIALFSSKIFGKSSSSKPLTDYVPGTLDYTKLPVLQKPTWATTAATKRLMKDFKDIMEIQNKEPPHELGWHIDEDKMDNIYQWIVELHSFDSTLPLAKDMKSKDVKSIVLELRFGKDYPMSPPFVRVIRPRFLSFQQGGGGHVTAGGAMCMQLLTNDGWSAVSSIESVLLQVRMAISNLDPKPARLQGGAAADYGVGEAVEAYMRACAVHGWTVPTGFKEMAYGGSSPEGYTPF
ncbi:ubiquitin-conjugating enzyme E2 Q [Alternaria panax]|uniref:Ubiquitin-conjugating enzyme E2 Q n=1 Tax=Alternaria panax TaxID=48097 RepID=A0AAD4FCV3_9PLEO|nr:ubiquitin-conjugating enzyme E2 Q [Alternaria panax]